MPLYERHNVREPHHCVCSLGLTISETKYLYIEIDDNRLQNIKKREQTIVDDCLHSMIWV